MKNNKKLIIIISVVVLLLISLIVFLVVFKNKDKLSNNDKSTSTTTKESIEINPEIYSSVLLVSLRSFNNCNTGYTFDFTSKDKLEYKDLSKDFIYNTIYNYLKVQKKIDVKNSSTNSTSAILTEDNYQEETFSLNDLLFAYHTLYGFKTSDINYDKSFNIGDYKYELNSENNYYTKKTSSPNCIANNIAKYVLSESVISDEKIVLTYILYYTVYSLEDTLVEYATNKLNGDKICNAFFVNDDKYSTNFTKYKFTFVRSDLTYIFDNVTLVK